MCHHLLKEGLGSEASRNLSWLLLLSSLGREGPQGPGLSQSDSPYSDKAQCAFFLASLRLAAGFRHGQLPKACE